MQIKSDTTALGDEVVSTPPRLLFVPIPYSHRGLCEHASMAPRRVGVGSRNQCLSNSPHTTLAKFSATL